MVDDRETCKVADFGLLREIPKDNTIYQAMTELPWPIRWMAPESLDNREFSPATDVWGFGVLLWEMYYPNQLPYAELNSRCVYIQAFCIIILLLLLWPCMHTDIKLENMFHIVPALHFTCSKSPPYRSQTHAH